MIKETGEFDSRGSQVDETQAKYYNQILERMGEPYVWVKVEGDDILTTKPAEVTEPYFMTDINDLPELTLREKVDIFLGR